MEQKGIYLVSFRWKNENKRDYVLQETTEKEIQSMRALLMESQGLEHVSSVIEVPFNIISIDNGKLILADYDTALTYEPEFVEKHIYLWK